MAFVEAGNFESLPALVAGLPAVGPDHGAFSPFLGFSGSRAFAAGEGGEFRPVARRSEKEKQALEAERRREELEKREHAAAEHEGALQSREEELNARSEALSKRGEEIGRVAATAASTAADFEEMKKGYWRENAAEIVAFAIELAEKIVMDRLGMDPGILARHIGAVLEQARPAGAVTVRVAPMDLEAMKNSSAPEVKGLMEMPSLEWVSDVRLKTGEVHVDTASYRLDASLATAVRNMKIALAEDGDTGNDGGTKP